MSFLVQVKQIGWALLILAAYFLAIVVYFAIGCVFSAPYTFLAGWNFDNFFLGAWLMLPILAFLFVFWKIMRYRQHKLGGSAFWMIVMYFCLPIILNGSSIFLKSMGCETVSHYVFMARYFSLWAIPVFLIVCMIILKGIATLQQRFNGNITPSS